MLTLERHLEGPAPARYDGGERIGDAVAPNAWAGQTECILGPFATRAVAERFTGCTSEFGCFATYRFRMFAEGATWYVQVRAASEVHASA